MTSSTASVRSSLLFEVRRFVGRAGQIRGVCRIALIGSLATEKASPKDADVLLTIEEDADLQALAAAGRQFQGRTQSQNRGADIFLADTAGNYLGRICHWRDCRPGIRQACDARHCGRRQYLHDDLDAIKLSPETINLPPLEVWPKVVPRGRVPLDVLDVLADIRTDVQNLGTAPIQSGMPTSAARSAE
jgi:hypothetical protein